MRRQGGMHQLAAGWLAVGWLQELHGKVGTVAELCCCCRLVRGGEHILKLLWRAVVALGLRQLHVRRRTLLGVLAWRAAGGGVEL